VVKTGDKIPLGGVDIVVVASAGTMLKTPLPGGGIANPACARFQQGQSNVEDMMSVGIHVTFEIALAKIKVFRKAEDGASSIPAELEQRKPLIRLSQSADIVPLEYDLRGLFEKHASKVSPAKRPHCLLIVQLNRRRRPSVMEVSDAMKEILTRMVNWTMLEDVLETIGPDRSSLKDTLQTYLKSGIVEVAQ